MTAAQLLALPRHKQVAYWNDARREQVAAYAQMNINTPTAGDTPGLVTRQRTAAAALTTQGDVR